MKETATLLSLPFGRYLINGWKLSRDADRVQLSKNGVEMKFDIVIQTKKGVLLCCLIKQSQGFNTVGEATKGGRLMSLENAHCWDTPTIVRPLIQQSIW